MTIVASRPVPPRPAPRPAGVPPPPPPRPNNPPVRPAKASRWNHAAIGFGVGCVLAVIGLLWLIGAGK